MTIPSPSDSSGDSQLFTIRVWVESREPGKAQLRIQVKHILSGATRSFRTWTEMIAFLEETLTDRPQS